jgi:NADH-quinone oxidoreductase subunit J
MMGAEFLAMLLVVVYVGAVAVLFLFVVMMLDVDFVELKQGFMKYLPIGALVGIVLFAELVLVSSAVMVEGRHSAPAVSGNNAEEIGKVLYTDYLVLFQLSGLVLFVAMIGAVVLTLRARAGVRRQDVGVQVGRKRKEAVALQDVRPGQGLS